MSWGASAKQRCIYHNCPFCRCPGWSWELQGVFTFLFCGRRVSSLGFVHWCLGREYGPQGRVSTSAGSVKCTARIPEARN